MDELYWIWLSLAVSPGTVLPNELVRHFGSAKAVWEADEEALKSVSVPFYGHEKALCEKDTARAKEVRDYCRRNGVLILTPESEGYPEPFRSLANAPAVLYALGDPDLFSGMFTAAAVGSRHPTSYGEACAKRISYDLARSGAGIVSGLAEGVDALAHRGALAAGGKTCGVIGCGIDRVYPSSNEDLYREVAKKGLILSEFAPGTPPSARNFPIRNRLIAALADAVLVIEGSEKSGSLITAEEALKQQKPLYSVPGSIFASQCAGSNFLLKLGARPLLSPYEVLSDFQDRYPYLHTGVEFFEKERDRRRKEETEQVKKAARVRKTRVKKEIGKFVFSTSEKKKPKETEAPEKPLPPAFTFREEAPGDAESAPPFFLLNEEERAVLERIPYTPAAADAVVREGESVSDLLRVLTKLEINGLVRRMPGGKFVRADRAEDRE